MLLLGYKIVHSIVGLQIFYNMCHPGASLASSARRSARTNLPTEGRGHLSSVWSLSNSLKEGMATNKAFFKE